MFAIPVQKKVFDPEVSDVFALSKWFVIFNNETMTFEKNDNKNGQDVIKWLSGLGVHKIITKKIGIKAYNLLQNDYEIKCYSTSMKNKLTDVIRLAKDERLKEINVDTDIVHKNCIN
jgi:predicted Fe-Mo cluster-binding NifX family protein